MYTKLESHTYIFIHIYICIHTHVSHSLLILGIFIYFMCVYVMIKGVYIYVCMRLFVCLTSSSISFPLQTPLHIGAARGHVKVIEYLIQHKGDIEAKDVWM